MLLIYAEQATPRLQYIGSFIFKELMQADIGFTTDIDTFKLHDGVRINYSSSALTETEIRIGNAALLFETGIQLQPVDCFETNGYKAFFKTEGTDFSFDIFAACFYLLSRYEEYLPHTKDIYGRYAHENSLAFKAGFLQMPLVNIWVAELIKIITTKFPLFKVKQSGFCFIPTYDVDMAFAYKYKGFVRNIGGFLKSPSLERIKVLAGLQQDPFDVFEWLDNLHTQNALQPVYFFLLAASNSRYDKNILPQTNVMNQLVKAHAKKYSTGIHPGWQSGDDEALLHSEINTLKDISGKPVIKSRQHYIRFNLPEGYQRLINAGITDDYSMGYGSINGFRASVASSFYWYDLQKEEQTTLRIHPFCFMEANSFYEQKISAEDAYKELLHYYSICKKVNGQLITIWHNNFFGTDPQFAGWRECYEQFIALVQQ